MGDDKDADLLLKNRKFSTKPLSTRDMFNGQLDQEPNTAISKKQKLMTMIEESGNSRQASVFGDHDSVVSKEFNK